MSAMSARHKDVKKYHFTTGAIPIVIAIASCKEEDACKYFHDCEGGASHERHLQAMCDDNRTAE